jgi:putative transposase
MPRAVRVVFSSMPYHIISRGNHREPVFEEKEEFEKYLEICRRYKNQLNKKAIEVKRPRRGRPRK